MSRKKRLLLLIPLVLVLAFALYVTDYYHADETALRAMESDGAVSVEQTDYGWRFDGPGEDAALVFYPGGKVQAEAYAPFMRRLAEAGLDACLVKMPLQLAFFDMNAAGRVMKAHDYPRWYVGGHSLGGAAAAMYSAKHPDGLEGLVLCAAYPTSALPDSLTEISLYGSEDGVLNMDRYAKGRDYAPKRFVERVIEGGSHAGFGNYGPQKGDGAVTITPDAQQAEAAEIIIDAINENGE